MRWWLPRLSDLSVVWRCQILTQTLPPFPCLVFIKKAESGFQREIYYLGLVQDVNLSVVCLLIRIGVEATGEESSMTPSQPRSKNGLKRPCSNGCYEHIGRQDMKSKMRVELSWGFLKISIFIYIGPARKQWYGKRQLLHSYGKSSQIRILCYKFWP